MRPLLPAAIAALTIPLLPAAPSGAANDQDPRIVEKRIVYVCESSVGGGDTEVFVRAQLPRTVPVGKKMAARPIDFTVVVPEEMAQTLRDNGVEQLSAESDDATYRVGGRTRDIRDLAFPATEVPPEGTLMILEGQGTAQAIRLTRIGTYPVKMPEAFTAQVTATGQFTVTDELSCVLAEGQRTKIGKVSVE